MRVEVERMAYGPDAIAHDAEGRVVMVSGAVAGDVVEAEVTEDRGSFVRARATEVVEPSPDRVGAVCPLDGACGGCPWARLSREAQLVAKRSCVVDALSRIGHVDRGRAEDLVRPTLAAGDPWGYRNKVELAFAREGGRAMLGMHAREGAGVVRCASCPLLDEGSRRLVRGVSGALSYLAGSHELDVGRVAIRTSSRTGDLEVALWTPPSPFPRHLAAKVLGDAVSPTSVVRVIAKGPAKARRVARVERLSGAGSWSERVAGGVMRLSAPSFFQVNTAGADLLASLVLEALDPGEGDACWDLYSGAGTFTLPLARRAGWVEAIEAAGSSVRDLRRNLEAEGLDNVGVTGGDVAREAPDESPDLVVVDPPRAGLAGDVVRALSGCGARRICYVSCDPATLARDLARFEAAGPWRPVSVQPVDQFAQTYHVETVTLLEPRG